MQPSDVQVDLGDPDAVIAVLDAAAEAGLAADHRRGSVAALPACGHLVITGDLHDHSRNLRAALKLADLGAGPDRYLVLHELIHGPDLVNGLDLSIRTLVRVAAIKAAFPEQVLLLLSNHELAQRNGEDILKGGVSVVRRFEEGVGFVYGRRADAVLEAMGRYVASLLLAVRCANGLFIAHSLPAPSDLAAFDPGVIDRALTEADLRDGGSASMLVWGRRHDDAVTEALAAAWAVDLFVVGHQPVMSGFETVGSRMLVIASDDGHGVAVPVDLSARYSLESLCDRVRRLAGVVP